MWSLLLKLATLLFAVNTAADIGHRISVGGKNAQERQRLKRIRMFPSQAARRLHDELVSAGLTVRVRAALDTTAAEQARSGGGASASAEPVLIVYTTGTAADKLIPTTYGGYAVVQRQKRS